MTSCLLSCMTKPFQKNSTRNPIALRMAKTLWSFGRSECNRVKGKNIPPQRRAKLFPSRVDPIEKGDKNENCRVGFSERVSIHLKALSSIRLLFYFS